jgi:hypothetical protein
MTSHAHNPGDSVSTAKLGLYGGIATALITAFGGIIVAVMNHINVFGDTDSQGPTATTIIPTSLSQESDRGSYDKLAFNDSGTVTVSGRAENGVDGVFVLVGPKPSGGYWVGFANVFNEHWQADVPTESQIEHEPYSITTYYHRPGGGAARQSAFKLTFQGTEPTTPPPSPTNQIVNCAEQFGPNCFTGPGWGPPSVYQSK